MDESKKITEGLFNGPTIKADDLQIGDLYIDGRGNLSKVIDRPIPEGELGTLQKQLTKMFMPNQQNLKGTKWETEVIRYATKEDQEKYPHIIHSKRESKKVTEEYDKNTILNRMFCLYPDIDEEDEDYLISLSTEELVDEIKNRGWNEALEES